MYQMRFPLGLITTRYLPKYQLNRWQMCLQVRFSILRKVVAAISISIAVIGCSDKSSDPNFNLIYSASDEEQVYIFRKLSLEERLRIYKKMYLISGHPKDSHLALYGFSDKPKETMYEIIKELKHSNFSEFMMYRHIIFYTARTNSYSLCEDHYAMDEIHRAIVRYSLNQSQIDALREVDYGGCRIV